MNRTVVLTGGNNGIGLAMTGALREMGDRVAALDLSLENLQRPRANLLPRIRGVTDRARVIAHPISRSLPRPYRWMVTCPLGQPNTRPMADARKGIQS